MVFSTIKRALPCVAKHPWQATERWYWRYRRFPHQNAKEIRIFKDLLCRSGGDQLRVFEWGAGSSTIYYAKFLRAKGRKFQWFAMDNSEYWSGQCRSELARLGLSEQVTVDCSNFPAYWEHPGSSPGNPVVPETVNASREVAEYVEKPKALGGGFDVIFIDGRYRRRCLIEAKEALGPNGIVILHDAERTYYLAGTKCFTNAELMLTGKAPGTATKSAVVFCTNESNDLIRGLSEEYFSHWQTLNR